MMTLTAPLVLTPKFALQYTEIWDRLQEGAQDRLRALGFMPIMVQAKSLRRKKKGKARLRQELAGHLEMALRDSLGPQLAAELPKRTFLREKYRDDFYTSVAKENTCWFQQVLNFLQALQEEAQVMITETFEIEEEDPTLDFYGSFEIDDERVVRTPRPRSHGRTIPAGRLKELQENRHAAEQRKRGSLMVG